MKPSNTIFPLVFVILAIALIVKGQRVRLVTASTKEANTEVYDALSYTAPRLPGPATNKYEIVQKDNEFAIHILYKHGYGQWLSGPYQSCEEATQIKDSMIRMANEVYPTRDTNGWQTVDCK